MSTRHANADILPPEPAVSGCSSDMDVLTPSPQLSVSSPPSCTVTSTEVIDGTRHAAVAAATRTTTGATGVTSLRARHPHAFTGTLMSWGRPDNVTYSWLYVLLIRWTLGGGTPCKITETRRNGKRLWRRIGPTSPRRHLAVGETVCQRVHI